MVKTTNDIKQTRMAYLFAYLLTKAA